MVLGSVYLGGAYFFVRVVRPRGGTRSPVDSCRSATFATLMGVTTILHWDRFLHGNVAFWLWVGLYFTTPVLVFLVFFRNQREYDSAADSSARLAPAAAAALVLVGVASMAMCVFLYLFRRAPWPSGRGS